MVVAQGGGVGVGAHGQQAGGGAVWRRGDEQLTSVPGRLHLGTGVMCATRK